MGQAAPGAVRRRHVLYLSGFDPQGPGHYHSMYARESQLQAAVTGDKLSVGARRRIGSNAYWDVLWQPGGVDAHPVQTRYEFMRWDDIVRDHWPRGQWRLLLATVATTARLATNGSLWRILQTSWPAFLALAMPAGLIAGVLAGVAAICGLAGLLLGSGVHAWAVASASVIAGLALLSWARWLQSRVQMAWLMRSASVILKQARGDLPELERRLDDFAERLCAVVESGGLDEVLVVGHSSGTMLAVSVMARALRARPELLTTGPKVGLITLGECIPLLSYQPEAGAFRDELSYLRAASGLVWVDVTAPPDGCCFALVDPTAVCNDGHKGRAADGRAPKLVSPRFAECFSEQTYAKVRRDKYRCHFQYLMSVERPGQWDYFRITAGPLSLAESSEKWVGVKGYARFQCFGGPER